MRAEDDLVQSHEMTWYGVSRCEIQTEDQEHHRVRDGNNGDNCASWTSRRAERDRDTRTRKADPKKPKEGCRKGCQETKSDNATSALCVNGYEHVREDLFTRRPNERTVLKPFYITYMFLCQICRICNLSSTTWPCIFPSNNLIICYWITLK